MKLIRLISIFLFVIALPFISWAQPSTIDQQNITELDCKGKLEIKFQAGVDESSDDYITDASLYIEDETGSEREILYITNSGSADTEIDMGFEDWEWSRRSTGMSNTGEIESVTASRTGDNHYFIVTIRNLTKRSSNDIKLRLNWSWDGDQDFSDENTTLTVTKKPAIDASFVTATRDQCNQTEAKITMNNTLACLDNEFSYTLTLEESSSSDFSASTTLLNNKSFNAGTLNRNFVETLTRTNVGPEAKYYQSTIKYIKDGLVFQEVKSQVSTLQELDLAPPIAISASNELCDNQIKVEWKYDNPNESTSFEIYRSLDKEFGLDFIKGDKLTVDNFNNGSQSEMTFEISFLIENTESQVIFSQPATEFYVYINNEGQISIEINGRTLYGPVIPTNSWIDLSLVYSQSSGNSILYINKEHVSSLLNIANPISFTDDIITFGYFPEDASTDFSGKLANVRFWNKVIPQSDLHNNITGAEIDLALYLDFDVGNISTMNVPVLNIDDKSSNNRNVTFDRTNGDANTSSFITLFSNFEKIGEANTERSGQNFEYTDNQNIASDESYGYAIKALSTCDDNVLTSLFSNTVVGKSPTNPLSPTEGDIMISDSTEVITLSWKDNSFDETRYIIRRKFGDATSVFYAEANDTMYVDESVVPCRLYEYDIFAENICGESNESVSLSGRIEPILTNGLSNDYFSGSKGVFSNRVELKWTPQNNTSVNRYRIYRKNLGESDSIQISSVSGAEQLYRDETASSGVIYEYTIVGEVDCDGGILKTNAAKTIGFSSATATISGQVTYTGGIAVEGVAIRVAPVGTGQTGQSISMDGVDDHIDLDTLMLSNQSFTLDFWTKPESDRSAALIHYGSTDLMAMSNVYVGYNNVGYLQFAIGNDTLTTDVAAEINEWTHWSCVYDATNSQRLIYINDSLSTKKDYVGLVPTVGKLLIGSTLTNNRFYQGKIDEFRMWRAARDSASIVRDYNRILNSNESALFISLSFNEGVGYGVYDRSKSGIMLNNNHGILRGSTSISDMWSTDIPSMSQLSLISFTDASGNYILSAVPFTDNGQVVSVIPQLGTHQFDPSQTNIYIGNNAEIHNNINFTDISSFPVSGSVYYQGTTCPAKSIELRVDGEPVIINGEKVVTSSFGQFQIDVPIGRHRISLFKDGHEFEVGQWPTDGSLFDFQEPISGIEFIDATQLKILGRVVGGTREGDKKLGLDKSVNNIGVARVIFESVAGNGCHRDTVFTDMNTGEYSAELYPLEYNVVQVRVMNPDQNIITSDFGVLPLLKLTEVGQSKSIQDTIFVSGTENIQRIDSVSYHEIQNFIYRKTAEIEVTNEDGSGPFVGSENITAQTEGGQDTIINIKSLVESNTDLYPIIEQAIPYYVNISVFEEYQNYDVGAPITLDKVPVTDGTLIINNNLAETAQQVMSIDVNDGDTLYVFRGGTPNLLTDANKPEYSFTKTMDISLERPGQVEDVKWYPRTGVSIDERLFRAYTLGFESVDGSNFVTQGPERVDFVLRDPPGTSSTATFTAETAISTSTTYSIVGGVSGGVSTKVKTGTEFQAGVGVSTKTKADITKGGGWELGVSVTGTETSSSTFTSVSGYTTNENPEAVGYRSDVYVGQSFNVNFGISKQTQILPSTICDNPNVDCREIYPGFPFKIGKTIGFYTAPSDESTVFAYTHNHIVNYLIPNLRTIRNNLFLSSRYTNKADPDDEEKYGSNNDNVIWNSMATEDPNKTSVEDADGPSYTWVGDIGDYSIGTDSIRWYNQQIELWENAVAQNEADKLKAINGGGKYKEELISYDGETTISRSATSEYEEQWGWEIEISASKEFVQEFEAEVAGTGTMAEANLKIEATTNRAGETVRTSSTTWEYELADGDQGDFMSLQVYKSPLGWGPIFQVIAGQTGCPHEDAVKTEYHLPGTVISNRTLQRDKVAVDIAPKVVQNVPEGEAAVFNVQFQNISETNDAREYAVRIDPTSNPDGLSINMDGETITVPNEFALPGSSVLSKVITVERGPEKFEYNDIRLLFYVPCQYAAGTADEVDLVDTATFSVTFLPECTDIRLKEPEDKWVLNTANDDSLTITIDNYDINKNGFESVSLQYRPSSESRWTELNKWWHPINKLDESGDKIPTNRSFIRYFWNMGSFPDGEYHLRTVSECELADNETEFMEGTADRMNPHPFGTPMPSDGICDPGEDIGIRFNEPIDIGSLNALNFDIRGVLNGSPLRHQESVAFDGSNDHIEVAAYDLTNRTFSIEAWVKPNSTTEGVIISQGLNSDEGLSISLDNSNKIVFKLAGQTLVSNSSLDPGEWKQIAISYQDDIDRVQMFINGNLDQSTDTFEESYESTSNLYFGDDISGSQNGFNGNLHEVRLWSRALSVTDIVPNINVTISPTSNGLIGYWPMNEGYGDEVEDRVRKRNGKISGASWSILPLGQAFSFNGATDYLYSDIPTINMSLESDATFEFWFKSSTSGTILSNGYLDESNSWSIGLNAAGQISIGNNESVLLSDTNGYNDDDWHHIAVVLERNSAINLYIDGFLMKSGDSRLWGGFSGSKLWVGAKGSFAGPTEMRDDYFDGLVDEVRIWNSARTPEQIDRDKNFRLAADELGLLLYYPFENYELDAGIPVLRQSLKNIVSDEYNLITGGSTSLNYVQPTPPIKLPRPVEKVNFTFSVNQDEIILTPTDPSGRLEHATLDITTKDVYDLNGNKMESPATWIAFINKNQILWGQQDRSLAIEKGEGGSFEVEIINSGGSAERFSISNLPAWLTPSIVSETIAPNSSITVRFDISSGVNIGKYEEDIFLSTDFGFSERFTLNLKVSAIPPLWTLNSGLFQYSMSYTGQLAIDGIISIDEEDQIAVFIDGELRGSAFVELDPGTNKYLVYLDVYSNSTIGEDLEFRIWNASEGTVHTPVSPTNHKFRLHEFIGTPIRPQLFEADERIEETYELKTGWNWISFPLESQALDNVNLILTGLDPLDNDRILSQETFDIYSGAPNFNWNGTLSATGGFDRREGYQMYLSNPGSFSYSGSLGNPSDVPIELEEDWNWIGFIGDIDIEINEALASLNPTEGDIIKGQRSFAIYEPGVGWNGSLDILRPKESYMIKLAIGGTLIYPNKSKVVKNHKIYKKLDESINLLSQANIQFEQYINHMTILGQLDNRVDIGNSDDDYFIVAYVNNIRRGITPINQNQGDYIYFTIHGVSEESLTFSIVDANMNEVYKLDNVLSFNGENLIGEIDHPYVFHMSENNEDAQLVETDKITVLPNPFSDAFEVNYNSVVRESGEVTLEDINGVKIKTIHSGVLSKGINTWHITDLKGSLPMGIYIITVQSATVNSSLKVVKS